MTTFHAFSHPDALLRRRHREQVLLRSTEDHKAMSHLAARTFLPIDGSGCFQSPIQPIANVMVAALSSVKTNLGGTRLYFRGYRPWFDRKYAITRWDRHMAIFAHDLQVPFAPDASSIGLPNRALDLCRTVLDLDLEIFRVRHDYFLLQGFPVLPPTLLAHAKDTPITPEATPMVLRHAEIHGISWQDAWHKLRQQLQVPEELSPSGCQLIDTRLVTHSALVSARDAANIFLDLREFMGRPGKNYFRDCRFPADVSDSRLIATARQQLPRPLQRICTDTDILTAIRSPKAPLIRNRVPAIQVWVPPIQGAITVHDFGVDADLYHVHPQQMSRLELPELSAQPTIGQFAQVA